VQVATIDTMNFPKVVKKFKTHLSAGTITANVFWNSEGVIHVYFLPRGVKMNTQYYSNLFRKDVHQATLNKRPRTLVNVR
jgi:hypothetical protein